MSVCLPWATTHIDHRHRSQPLETSPVNGNVMESIERMLIHFNPERFVNNGDERRRWTVTWQAIGPQLRAGSLQDQEKILGLIRSVSIDQQIIAQAMITVESQAKETMLELEESLDKLDITNRQPDCEEERCRTETTQPPGKRRGREDDDNETTDMSPASPGSFPEEADEHLRDWFVTNIAYPFPDKPTKTAFTTATGMDFRQLNTWFTNMRRRSGYTEYLRAYAPGNKPRFREMCVDALNGGGDPGLKAVVQGMQRYAEKKPRGKVGDWLLNVSLIAVHRGIILTVTFTDHRRRSHRGGNATTSKETTSCTSRSPARPTTLAARIYHRPARCIHWNPERSANDSCPQRGADSGHGRRVETRQSRRIRFGRRKRCKAHQGGKAHQCQNPQNQESQAVRLFRWIVERNANQSTVDQTPTHSCLSSESPEDSLDRKFVVSASRRQRAAIGVRIVLDSIQRVCGSEFFLPRLHPVRIARGTYATPTPRSRTHAVPSPVHLPIRSTRNQRIRLQPKLTAYHHLRAVLPPNARHQLPAHVLPSDPAWYAAHVRPPTVHAVPGFRDAV